MSEIERPGRFYVWVYTPSVVRAGHLAGAYARDIDWRCEIRTGPDFDMDAVAREMLLKIAEVDEAPTFYGPSSDAPVSNEFVETLKALAQGEP